ncbi:hypothetical protein TGAM01_v203391 [Trichoderma gamsii]|uniref:Uncharacterized protein n=1 Tax=Trichoderma gamsii TaxID=398673 RepID=A0A2P4ZTJ7_9HYPO|nr:hypothetical protein TGAM01_v203391 [Trichoderma gamsii]PON27624.1 hypothetical protein TGAM01_v203391 [Trichoderma gamsii]
MVTWFKQLVIRRPRVCEFFALHKRHATAYSIQKKDFYVRIARSEASCRACCLDFSDAREKQDDNIEAAHRPSCISVVIPSCSSIWVSFFIPTLI